MFKEKMRRKWLLYSVGGLSTIGFGLSLLGEAILNKMQQDQWWILLGTIALVVTNSGICLVAEATLLKMKMKQRQSD
ncbi:MAG: hypothetical protein ISP72_01815 [Flavobacteriaceae bacterium]|nr:hypothetical protein [Flavobacteriaceae bacterium]